MDANRFYSVPYDARNDTKVDKLAKRQKGKMAAFGRWQALLGILYDEDGLVDLSDEATAMVVREQLEFRTAGQMDDFFDDCAEVGLIDKELWKALAHVVNGGVTKELGFKGGRSSAGKMGGRGKRRAKEAGEDKAETES